MRVGRGVRQEQPFVLTYLFKRTTILIKHIHIVDAFKFHVAPDPAPDQGCHQLALRRKKLGHSVEVVVSGLGQALYQSGNRFYACAAAINDRLDILGDIGG